MLECWFERNKSGLGRNQYTYRQWQVCESRLKISLPFTIWLQKSRPLFPSRWMEQDHFVVTWTWFLPTNRLQSWGCRSSSTCLRSESRPFLRYQLCRLFEAKHETRALGTEHGWAMICTAIENTSMIGRAGPLNGAVKLNLRQGQRKRKSFNFPGDLS